MANISRSRKSGIFLRGGVKVRETKWVPIAPTFTSLAANTPVIFTGFAASQLSLRPFTIIRVRGFIVVATDQAIAFENFQATLGMAVVSEQALAIGVTAVPTPEADRDSDLFFVFEEGAGVVAAITSTGIAGNSHARPFDSKGMRKVEEGQDIAITEENTAGGGVTMFKSGRLLMKLF